MMRRRRSAPWPLLRSPGQRARRGGAGRVREGRASGGEGAAAAGRGGRGAPRTRAVSRVRARQAAGQESERGYSAARQRVKQGASLLA